MNIHLAEGTLLDTLVLVALGLKVTGDGSVTTGSVGGVALALCGDPAISPWLRSPSREWAVGGPLIERNRIGLRFQDGAWHGECAGSTATGLTPLVAAMRALSLAAGDKPMLDPDLLKAYTHSELAAQLFDVIGPQVDKPPQP